MVNRSAKSIKSARDSKVTRAGAVEIQDEELEQAAGGADMTLEPSAIGSATGGAGAGKIKFNEFTIKKTSDSASPVFFKNCVVGAHYTNVIITMRKSGGDPQAAVDAFIQWSFDDVLTTKIDWTGPGDEGPEERVSFVYGKVGMSAAGPDGVLISSGPFDTVER